MIRLAIVEDHPAVADGLVTLLRDAADVDVVGVAREPVAAGLLIKRQNPDVVLCDVRLANSGDGFSLVRGHPGTSFVMLSAYTYPSYHVRAIELGARGFLSKMATVDEILSALRAVATGGTAFPMGARRALREALRMPTSRELEIVGLVAEGFSNTEIADRLSLRLKTIESQLRRLFDRYDVGSRTALVRLAERQGWIEGDR